MRVRACPAGLHLVLEAADGACEDGRVSGVTKRMSAPAGTLALLPCT